MSNYAAVSIASYLGNPSRGFTLVTKATPPHDPDYIDGAIDLFVHGVPILDRELWDCVDQLWAYICNMVEELRTQEKTYSYFPDQPVKLTFKRIRAGQILVSLNWPTEGRQAVVEEDLFLEQLQESGREFFEQMKDLVPINTGAYDEALARLTSAGPEATSSSSSG
ncbi:hypothetical protein [Streptomyces sp. NRRL S-481]|uniref:hypothetical protein n=1 Tax=Streptomyces sp. NRRL S-481 TaxID=1463911 RepID=UPI0006905042|nr:hypothetical protein [Streptomyces sp. NRRL S-481]